MLDVLVFSRPPRLPGRWTFATCSLTLHTLVAGGAILAATVAAPAAGPAIDTTMVFLTAPEPDRRAPEPEPAGPQQVLVADALRGFQTIVAITDIPVGIPPIDLAERFDPRDYSGRGVEGGVADGIVAPAGVATDAVVYSARVVEEIPERLFAPTPAYPPLLQQAGIEGKVVLEFVVDSVGRVESRSVRVVSSDNPGFDPSSVTVARKMMFRPGRVNGRAVRVLVRMDFNFVLTRNRG
jgi:protein TonB